jgi:ABC-type nitrate/sulfonate/bicarbonate transport system permease component
MSSFDVTTVPTRRSAEKPKSTRRAGSRSRAWRAASIALANGVPILVLLAWALASQGGDQFALPGPVDVGERAADMLGFDWALTQQTLISLSRVAIAVVVAMVLGIALVVTAKYVPVTDGLISGRISPFFNAAPALGWAVVTVYWFGVTGFTVVFVETVIILPFVIINASEGLKNLDEELVEMGDSFTRTRVKTFRRVVLPQLLPYGFAALRLCYGTAWKVALFAELFGAPSGLGFVLNRARENLDVTTVYASFIVIIVMVYVIQKLVIDPLEHALTPQRRAENTLLSQ